MEGAHRRCEGHGCCGAEIRAAQPNSLASRSRLAVKAIRGDYNTLEREVRIALAEEFTAPGAKESSERRDKACA